MYQYITVVKGGSPYVLPSVASASSSMNKATYTVVNPDSAPIEHFFTEVDAMVLAHLSSQLSSNVTPPPGWDVEVWMPAGPVATRSSSMNPSGAAADGSDLFAPQIADPGSSYNPPWEPSWGGLHFYWMGSAGAPIVEGSSLDFAFFYDVAGVGYALDGTNLTVAGEEANGADYFATVGGPRTACDVNGDGKINLVDIEAIVASNGTPANGAADPRDPDRDGLITFADAQICKFRCTPNKNCAP
jgi:hypothetical protein